MDEGNVCSMEEFDYHIRRFKRMFRTPSNTRTEIVVGNHDIGFHYRYVRPNKLGILCSISPFLCGEV